MKEKPNHPKDKRPGKKLSIPNWYIWIWVVLVLVGALVGFLAWHYNNRVLPNIYVGNAAVGNRTEADARKIVEDQVAQLSVTFEDGQTSVTVPVAELGVSVDVNATVQRVMSARKNSDVLSNLAIWQRISIPLVYTNDPGMLKAYIVAHFPNSYVDPQDAQLAFSATTNLFDVKPGIPGAGFDIKVFETALPDLAANPRTIVLPVTTVPIEPLIGDAAAIKAQAEINGIINLPIQFLRSGTVAYAATRAQIGSWAHFVPDVTIGTITVQFDRAKVKQFIDSDVAGAVTVLPRDRKVIVNSTTGAQTVIQEGRQGYQLLDSDGLADGVMTALAQKQSYSKEITVVEAPFKTVTITGGDKWIEVDLSSQTVTLYTGNTPVATFLASTGTAATPTAIGEGRIYAKYPMQTMTGTINGEYYYVPNIPWVSYFYGGEAFHGTYWHSNFGHPMSHGCVNLSIPNAKTLYDFAPIGTRVIVHA